ncbi:cytochrome c oxidase assembly protein [Nocardioides sp. DS6]|uniref:Cytochrome c oxidase assembly protein n=1 Tax=Nocardioides eburneus TaxID=3231482 RepID=A0ABV3SXJ0_9ACTN
MHDHGMGMSDLPQLGWSEFFGTWSLSPGWLVAVVLIGALYLAGRGLAGPATSVPRWRVASFLTGLVLLWVMVASAIGGYAMSLAWMHMVLHLTLIMVVPTLLVLGHPLTVLVESFREQGQARARRVLRSLPFAALFSPAFGLLVYTVVIVGTHLTSFMDHMARHESLMVGEQVVYVLAGWFFLLPLIGEEPVRSDLPYLGRIALLVVGMVPDTIVGIVMLQTNHDMYPVYSGMRPDWSLDAVRDIQTAGALMWAGGDGGMMFIAIGLVIAVITSPMRRAKMTGAFLEGVRRQTLVEHVSDSGAEAPHTVDGADLDPDGDEALAAYNRMLARFADHER